jgi:hypothetical protein
MKKEWNTSERCRKNSSCNNISHNSIKYLLILFSLYLINEYILKNLSDNIIIHGYFNDFLAPLLLFVWIDFWDVKKKARKYYCIIFIIACISWEVITPIFKENSVGDIKDVIAYSGGYLVYIILDKLLI